MAGPTEQRPVLATSKLVVATRRGYWGTQIKDPEGSATERAPFRVPAAAKASWFTVFQEARTDRPAHPQGGQAPGDGDIS